MIASTGLTAMRPFDLPGQWKQRGLRVAHYVLPFVAVGAALVSQIAVSWMLPLFLDKFM